MTYKFDYLPTPKYIFTTSNTTTSVYIYNYGASKFVAWLFEELVYNISQNVWATSNYNRIHKTHYENVKSKRHTYNWT